MSHKNIETHPNFIDKVPKSKDDLERKLDVIKKNI